MAVPGVCALAVSIIRPPPAGVRWYMHFGPDGLKVGVQNMVICVLYFICPVWLTCPHKRALCRWNVRQQVKHVAYEQLPSITVENVTELYEAYPEVMMSCKDFMPAKSVRPGLTMACNTCSQGQDALRLRHQDPQQTNKQKHIDIQSCLCNIGW